MDWSPLIKDYDGPLSVGWALDNGELVIRVRLPLGTKINLPASVRVIVSDDFETPTPLAAKDRP